MQENLTLEQQKKELQMTLSKFTHEIRNPVALIQSELQMLASAHPELNSYDGWYGIMENLEYIRELLNELSRYNNAEHLSPVQTDITLLLKSIIRSFLPCAGLPWDHSGNRYSPDPSPSLSGPDKNPSGASEPSQKCPGIHSALSRRYLCYGSRCY